MSVSVHCPSCGKQLIAPDQLIGKLAACPQCKTQFPVTQSSAAIGSPAGGAMPAPGESTPAAPPSMSRAKSLSLRASENAAQQEKRIAPDRPPAASASPDQVNPAERIKASVAAPQGRAAQTARFISGEPTETRINLGADGQLPSLILDDQQRAESPDDRGPQSNPLLLIVVLVFSFALSAVLLLVDTERAPSDSASGEDARAQLSRHYQGADPFLEPYEQVIRRALQAHHREDYATERRLYRRVLDMLHSENNSQHTGLTGQVKGDQPPSDEHLEELLSTLIGQQ